MKKILLFGCLFCVSFLGVSQNIVSYTRLFDSLFVNVSLKDATTGVLYDRVISVSDATSFNSRLNPIMDTVNTSVFLQCCYEMNLASFGAPSTSLPNIERLKNASYTDSIINVGLLHYKFNVIDSTIALQKLYFDEDSVLRENNNITQSLYDENEIFIASPLSKNISRGKKTFVFSDDFLFDNTGNSIHYLNVDFGDGEGVRIIRPNTIINVIYNTDGEHLISIQAVFENGSSLDSYSSVYCHPPKSANSHPKETITVISDIPFMDYSGFTANGTGSMRIYYANSDKILRKPILILDGFDPANKRKFETNIDIDESSLWDLLSYVNNGDTINIGDVLINNFGYDLILLDFDKGGDYIERNAMVCIKALKIINDRLSSTGRNEQIVVIGPSMGGQIAKYALKYIEQNNTMAETNFGCHNSRLWFSFDSPHQGANISLGAQALMYFYGVMCNVSNAKDAWDVSLNCPAAKQMLLHQFNMTTPSANTFSCSIHVNQYVPNPFYTLFYASTHNLGYPQNTRNIAITDGSLNGVNNNNGCSDAIDIHLAILNNKRLARIKLFPNSGECELFYGIYPPAKTQLARWFQLLFNDTYRLELFGSATNNFSIDAAPGGTYRTFSIIKETFDNNEDLGEFIAPITTNIENHCFMPITSTLDVSGNMNYSTDVSSIDLVADSLIPFDSYAGVMDSNMYHVTFNQQLVDYMLNEIETYIDGPRNIQLCTRQTYTLHLPQDSTAEITWLSSDNIQIIQTPDPTVINIIPLLDGDGWISATVSTLKHKKRLSNFPIQISINNSNNLPIVSNTTIPQQELNVSGEVLLPDTFCVENGKILTVTGILHCSPGTRLIVRPGGKLIVDGGVLTSACPIEMWQGIEVAGDRTKHQTASFQGVVELKNGAIIENAHCAIKTGLGDDNWHTTGGIIKASNTTFRNNRRAVAFLSYVDTAASGALRSNYSYFRDCTFTVDENNVFAQNNGEFIDHVTMWQVKGVNFYSCHFSNTAAMNDRKHAIYTEDAGFSVSKYCPITQPDCPCEIVESLRNTFTGFNIAIDVNTTGDQFPVTIDHSKFINNATGIRINGNHFVTITRNDFDLQNIPTSGITNIGLLLCNSTGYKVEDNRFHRAVINPYITPCGILVEQSGRENNNIYLNSFDTLYEGLYISGINGDVSGGLQMTCNEFLGNRYDIYMTSSAVVSPWQGLSSKGADNTFDNLSLHNLYNAGTQYITYFYSNNTSFYPAYVTSNVVRIGGASTNPRTPTFCNTGGGVPIGGGGIKSASGFQSDVDNYLSALTNNADGIDNENDSDNAPETIRNMRQSLSDTYYETIRYLMSDTLLDLDELEQWHTIAQPIADPYSLVETQFQNGNANSAVIAETMDETNNYADFHALKTLCGAGGSGINWYELTDSQIEQLQSIAELNTGRTSVMAKGVLCFFFGICYEDDWSMGEGGDTRAAKAKANPNDNEESVLVIYPNPTNNMLHIALSSSVIDKVVLYDLQGRVVECTMSINDGFTTLNLNNIPAGVYFIFVTDKQGDRYHQKIIKN